MQTVRPPKEELLLLLPQGPKRIAIHYRVHIGTVYRWFVYHAILPNGRPRQPHVCTNCDRRVTGRLKNGRCDGCYTFYRRHGRERTIDDIRTSPPDKFCRRCKEYEAKVLGLCENCYHAYWRTGKPRKLHIIRRGPCTHCGAPYQVPTFRRGLCNACRLYQDRTGTPRPPELWKRYCECGHIATHLDVRLTITTGTGFDTSELYDLCDDCWALEKEPVSTKGEATWQR